MAMVRIHQHDWTAVNEWFDRKAAEAGKPKGTLAYYGHSEVIKLDDPNLDSVRTCAENLAKQFDSLVADVWA